MIKYRVGSRIEYTSSRGKYQATIISISGGWSVDDDDTTCIYNIEWSDAYANDNFSKAVTADQLDRQTTLLIPRVLLDEDLFTL